MSPRKRGPEPIPAASTVEAAAGTSVRDLRRSAKTPAAALYRPHPDGSYVLWVTDRDPDEAGAPAQQVWWEGEEGWLWGDDGRYLVRPLGEEQRVALALCGPWRETQIGAKQLRSIEKAVAKAERSLTDAVTEERREAARQRDAVQAAVAALIPSTPKGLQELLQRAIQAEMIADTVDLIGGELIVQGSRVERGPAVEILERALEEMAAGGDQEDLRPKVIEAMAQAVDARAEHTMGHSERVTGLSVETARELGWDDEATRTVEVAGRLHDVGTGFCGREALIKAKLADAEREAVRRHAELGASILARAGYPAEVVAAVRGHHERWDGKGYPDGLRGDEITPAARIIALGEVFDAMTSARPWREPLPVGMALERMVEASGTQFDPGMVEAFLAARWRLDPDGQRALAAYQQPSPFPEA